MELRMLKEHEISCVCNLMQEMYVQEMSYSVWKKEQKDVFCETMEPEYLRQQMTAGNLLLWGAFYGEELCAAAGMHRDGQIMMLCVRENWRRKGIGQHLLNFMRDYAIAELHLPRVTMLVAPVTGAPYFYKRGFVLSKEHADLEGGVMLECRLFGGADVWGEMPSQYIFETDLRPSQQGVSYERKKVSAKTILILTAVILTVSFGLVSGMTLSHLAEEEPYIMQDYKEIGQEKHI